jgi:hypothetical protein
MIPSPDHDLVAFGLNAVDDHAPEYIGWNVPALAGCINDSSSMAFLGASFGLRATSLVSGYVGQMTGIGAVTPPYKATFDCTGKALRGYLATRAAAVHQRGGDMLTVFANSGHGTRDTYLLESVESLVLSDELLPDFELHALLAMFPKGSRIALFLDTCHAGGMDRAAIMRGRSRFAGKRFGEVTFKSSRPAKSPDIQANVAVFCAVDAQHTALDGDRNGAFTSCLIAAAQEGMRESTMPSWNAVFRRAAELCVLHFKQSPAARYYGDTTVWDTKPFMK